MLNFSVIGNLGRDAEVKNLNGNQFVSFNVASTESWTDKNGVRQERTTWVSCILNGDGGALLPYLKKGKRVYVSGEGSVKLYSSAVQRSMMAGANLTVRTIELLGGGEDDVPRHLYTTDGAQVDVYKAYFVTAKEIFGKELLSRSGTRYQVDANGYVLPINNNPAANGQQQVDTNETF